MTFALSYVSTGSAATETRQFIVSNGVLYAATGNWMNSGASNGPRIIRKDAATKPWVLENEFPDAPYDYIACACMAAVTFPGHPVILVTGFFGFPAVGTRSGADPWQQIKIGGKGAGQIRSFGQYTDKVTSVHLAFAGQNAGIISGYYDTTAPGDIRWGASPEIDLSGLPPMSGGHPQRVLGFAELGGKFYAAVGQSIYERQDGAHATWKRVWTNPQPGTSQSGCRGLTAIGGKLWVGVEGTNSRVAIIDPATWKDTTDLDVSGPNNIYCIIAYNNFCVTKDASGGEVILAGLDGSNSGPAHYVVKHNGKWSTTQWNKRLALPALAPQPMCSVRTIINSPFRDGLLYWGGYDCNSNKSNNTAWIVTSTVADALAGQPAAQEVEETDLSNRMAPLANADD